MEELKEPYIGRDLLEYLDDMFNLDSLLDEFEDNPCMQIGYIRGVRAVITHLKALNEEQELERSGE